jgi:predicted PurR-regulated permease PerM
MEAEVSGRTGADPFAKSPWIVSLISLSVVVAVLYLARGVLIPLTLAVVFSFLLAPVCSWLERLRLGRIASVLITVIVAFTAIGSGAWTAAVQVIDLAPKIPEYQRNVQAKLHSVNSYLSSTLGTLRGPAQTVDESALNVGPVQDAVSAADRPSLVRVVSAPQSPLEVISGLFGPMLVVTGSAGVVIVLVVFFLIRREDLRDRFIRLVGRGRVTVTTKVLEDAAARVSRYLLMLFIVNVTFGIPIAIGLYYIGVPNAVLWGILATILRFVPYIGPWAASVAPIGLSLAISAGWAAPMLTIGLFVLLELFSNNVLEPWLYGKNTGISAVALLVAAVFWTWLWGAVGLLLATPLTVCLLVLGKHIPQLSFLTTLLGTEPVFELNKRIYQRLLAGDQEEAAELLLQELEKRPLVEVYDTVLIPALALVERYWRRGEIEDSRHTFILEIVRASIEELGERRQSMQAKLDAAQASSADGAPPATSPATPPQLLVLCLPAHDEADEVAALMLAQLVEMRGCRTHVATVAALVTERADLVEAQKPDVVCISAMPPAGVMHARYLYRSLRGRFPDAGLLVGLWDATGELGDVKARIGCGTAAQIVSTLAAAEQQVCRLIPPLIQPSARVERSDGGAIVGEGALA